jgi:molybdate transport system substrate-binding protein
MIKSLVSCERIFLFILLAVLFVSCRKQEHQAVTVFAAASLQEVVQEITEEWSQRTGHAVRLQFDASSTLARQIQEGAPADLFFSADPQWADRVHALERLHWIGNRLACVVHKDVNFVDLSTVESLALGGEQVPVGRYAKTALQNMGIKLPKRVVYGSNVRDVLSKVSHGAAVAGIVYATDVAVDPNVRTAFLLPEDSHPRITYVAVLINPKARDLFNAIQQPWSFEKARQRGFSTLP